MTVNRRLRDAQRLNLERARDVLFETRAILAELERDNSVVAAVRRSLAEELDRLESGQLADGLEQSLLLRNRVRVHYL